jgi:hypothetical protein
MTELQQILAKLQDEPAYYVSGKKYITVEQVESLLQELEIKMLNNGTASYRSKGSNRTVPQSKATVIGLGTVGNQGVTAKID